MASRQSRFLVGAGTDNVGKKKNDRNECFRLGEGRKQKVIVVVRNINVISNINLVPLLLLSGLRKVHVVNTN